MGVSATEVLLVIFVALLLFGGRRVADIGRGLGVGIRNFKRGLAGEDDRPREPSAGPGAASPAAADKPRTGDGAAPAPGGDGR